LFFQINQPIKTTSLVIEMWDEEMNPMIRTFIDSINVDCGISKPNCILFLKKIPEQTVKENEPILFTASVTDSSLDGLVYSLEKHSITEATIDSKTGEFSWIPNETQKPATYLFKVIVKKDNFEDIQRVAKLLIEKINSNFNSKHNYKNNKNYSYHIILQDNLQQLSNFILEKKREFDFVIPKMNLNRNDNLGLREKILSMTAEERKRLGINKSTLWYIKKNLSEGKTPKIYEKILLKVQ